MTSLYYEIALDYNELSDEGLALFVMAFNNFVKYVDGVI